MNMAFTCPLDGIALSSSSSAEPRTVICDSDCAQWTWRSTASRKVPLQFCIFSRKARTRQSLWIWT